MQTLVKQRKRLSRRLPLGLILALIMTSGPISAQTPTVLTTYLGAYGSGTPTYTGATQVLPIRAYDPGVAGIAYVQGNLQTAGAPSADFTFTIFNNAGNVNSNCPSGSSYCLLINDLVVSQSYPWPYPELLPDGANHALSLTLGPLQLTSYRLQLNGNELQADLGFTLSGSFNYQIVLWAQDGSTYSDPWMITNGTWQSSSQTPTVLTTYLGAYGSGTPTYTDATQVIPVRAYDPRGVAGIAYVQGNLQTAGAPSADFTFTIFNNAEM